MSNEPEGRNGNSLDTTSKASPYFIFTQIGTHWRGRGSFKNLFVFGDSYSSKLSQPWRSDEVNRVVYDTVDEDTTWIDFLASSVSSHSSAVILSNFAFPGATVEYDLAGQLSRFFGRFPKGIGPGEATYVFFLGINDCGGIPGEDLSTLVKGLFNAIHRLYIDTAARNFIIVDVPPTNRSPAAVGVSAGLASRIKEWNDLLLIHAPEFVSSNAQATMLVFSSNKVLSEVLDDPGEQGFNENANTVVGRGIWRDSLHLSPVVHKIIASRLSSALGF